MIFVKNDKDLVNYRHDYSFVLINHFTEDFNSLVEYEDERLLGVFDFNFPGCIVILEDNESLSDLLFYAPNLDLNCFELIEVIPCIDNKEVWIKIVYLYGNFNFSVYKKK